jgi:hypothetical protein
LIGGTGRGARFMDGKEGRPMSDTVEVSPFFERGETSDDGFPADTYVAGFREARGTGGGVEITLPAEIVDRIVLTGARLSVSLSPEGRLVLDGEGLSDDVLEAASAAGGLCDQTLESLVSGCLNLDREFRPQHDAIHEFHSLGRRTF